MLAAEIESFKAKKTSNQQLGCGTVVPAGVGYLVIGKIYLESASRNFSFTKKEILN